MALPSISHKTNRILRLVLAALFLILFRIWHLSVLQREEKLSEAQKSQRKTHLIKANRGTICDRFHIPLALNRICYNAVIYYSHIAQIPASRWKSNELGVQVKTFPRKEYIKHLSQVLARELGIDPLRAEDEIHSKASLFPDAPYVIKADLTEKEHFRLCQLERDHPGLHAEISSLGNIMRSPRKWQFYRLQRSLSNRTFGKICLLGMKGSRMSIDGFMN